ncbi:MAG: class I SAM-dependent methyltransferase, partial [Ilumatobacteraceae bacterium]
PRCGSIARDRFLMWSFMQRDPRPAGVRLLETSPRLGHDYRQFMRTWFDYRASDFDLSAHVGDLQLDLQQVDLAAASVDVVLTPHVLEHVPDTKRALGELFRVIAPGGRMYLQVPLLHGDTRVPVEPEFHADNTPVFFNFGWDLIDQLEAAGFEVTVLVTDRFRSWLATPATGPSSNGDGFLVESLTEHARLDSVTGVADEQQSVQLGFLPPYHFVTWECRRP